MKEELVTLICRPLLSEIGRKVSKATGIEFKIYGFDTGKGMPPPESYRDHPDLYSTGDFPMNHDAFIKRLPSNARLILGELRATIGPFISRSCRRASQWVSFRWT